MSAKGGIKRAQGGDGTSTKWEIGRVGVVKTAGIGAKVECATGKDTVK
jgi:hypothetical protein